MRAKFTWRHCVWTIHAPYELKNAIVLPVISGECATHCNCSPLFHTCLQINTGSNRGGEFRRGKG